MAAWTGFIWLRRKVSWWFLWTWYWTFRFYKSQKIYCVDELLLVSQQGQCWIESVSVKQYTAGTSFYHQYHLYRLHLIKQHPTVISQLTCDYTAGRQSIQDDTHCFSPSSPFQMLESLWYKLHNTLLFQTTCESQQWTANSANKMCCVSMNKWTVKIQVLMKTRRLQSSATLLWEPKMLQVSGCLILCIKFKVAMNYISSRLQNNSRKLIVKGLKFILMYAPPWSYKRVETAL